MNDITTQDLPKYQSFLAQATAQIRHARTRAAQSVNKEAISLYWWLGEHIVQHQHQHGWGKSVVERLSKDLKRAFPDAKFGFSARNLWDMRRLYLEYNDYPKLRQLVAEIPWGQNLMILNKVKQADKRLYYLSATKEQAWTRDTLRDQINSNDSEYFIDLLFYHRKLQALVALELKRSRFKPEYAGKMNFYLNLLDEFVKESHENPSIGIILCGEHSRFDVEYALRGIDKPVGVAGYQLTRDIPEKLKGALPDAAQLEEKIQFELGIERAKENDSEENNDDS